MENMDRSARYEEKKKGILELIPNLFSFTAKARSSQAIDGKRRKTIEKEKEKEK